MRGALTSSLLITSLVGCGGLVVFDAGDDGGSSSGPPSDVTTSGQPPTGQGGAGGSIVGPEDCATPFDCPMPELDCFERDCESGSCLEIASPNGAVCSTGLCIQGICTCQVDSDCLRSNEICDVESGVCVSPPATGTCADTFCVSLPADNACASCLIQETQDTCSEPYQACNFDPAAGSCASCVEHLQGSVEPFCAGSQAKFEAFFDCVCAPGVCLD